MEGTNGFSNIFSVIGHPPLSAGAFPFIDWGCMFAVTKPDNKSDQFPDAKGYRIDKKGSLIVYGKHYGTLAQYPAGSWSYISQAPPVM
ncbi:hypothetical protein OZX67_03875 [Bifidobacterium sp. ESL0728]|uniref:hypothetical protein n=1 Tax=Bifidobacterium sp. ESL0728 TaxID=2983220 RepID=UPI0023F6E4FB|nr:hypothetical protein [Bifidobacterium sp. ESL0728]WEV59686.1 hypothetical protein OZX67_03875 [Bifidobacterium sp. ESL0728]